VIIGEQAKPEKADAMSCVFGYDRQRRASEPGSAATAPSGAARTPYVQADGPWIDTDVDIDAMQTIVRVNGKDGLKFQTNDAVFDIPTYIRR
jgi:hypothetical protein